MVSKPIFKKIPKGNYALAVKSAKLFIQKENLIYNPISFEQSYYKTLKIKIFYLTSKNFKLNFMKGCSQLMLTMYWLSWVWWRYPKKDLSLWIRTSRVSLKTSTLTVSFLFMLLMTKTALVIINLIEWHIYIYAHVKSAISIMRLRFESVWCLLLHKFWYCLKDRTLLSRCNPKQKYKFFFRTVVHFMWLKTLNKNFFHLYTKCKVKQFIELLIQFTVLKDAHINKWYYWPWRSFSSLIYLFTCTLYIFL